MIGLRQLMIFAGEVVRYVLWLVASGLISVGSSFYGSHEALGAWRKTRPMLRRPALRTQAPQPDERAIAREAAAGIARLEAFLGAPTEPRSPEPSDSARDGRRPSPGRS